MTRCTHDPKTLLGQPIGMFHCPSCGCMQVAGFDHSICEPDCEMQDDADRKAWDEATSSLDPLEDTRKESPPDGTTEEAAQEG